jgi:hypothetical protein
MTTKASHPAAAAKKKLHTQIAAAQKLADAAKKETKLAKLGFRTAKQKFKDARRAARKLRKQVKALKLELAGLAVKKKPARKPAPAKPAQPKPARRARLIVSPVTTATPFEAPAAISTPPAAANSTESAPSVVPPAN